GFVLDPDFDTLLFGVVEDRIERVAEVFVGAFGRGVGKWPAGTDADRGRADGRGEVDRAFRILDAPLAVFVVRGHDAGVEKRGGWCVVVIARRGVGVDVRDVHPRVVERRE